MNNDLVKVKQLPVIEEQLKKVSLKIDEEMKGIDNLVCTEESIQVLKKLRAKFNNEFKEYETQRKGIKEQIFKPYNQFEDIYKVCISDKFRNNDLILKGKINTFENEQKNKKEQEVKDYFEEYKTANNIDFITYEQARINVTLSASMKSLKEQAKHFIDKVEEDLQLIETQEHKAEILVEYKNSLNVSNAITTVTNRIKSIEKEKRKQEEFIKEASKAVIIPVEEKQEILQAPVVKEEQEELFTMSFKVKNETKPRLKLIKEFLDNGGYDYE